MMRFLQSCVYSLNIMIYFREKNNNEKMRKFVSILLIPAGIIRYIYISIRSRISISVDPRCAVVLIVKNEGKYIKEFIEYYSALNCDLIVYDNDSDDETASIIHQYNNIEYIFWPGKKRQIDAYNDAIKKHLYQYKYMMFFDTDEFLVADELLRGKSLFDILDSFYKIDNKIACLGINCLIFGSSGWIEDPQCGVIDAFTKSAVDDFEWNQLVKSCVIPSRIVGWVNPHLPLQAFGFKRVNLDGKKITQPRNDLPSRRDIRLYHYFVKNMKHFQEKVEKGMADRNAKRSVDEFYYYDKNDVSNYKAREIRDFIISNKNKTGESR